MNGALLSELRVRTLPIVRAGSAAGLLASSLEDDPAWTALYPEVIQRRAALRTTCGVAARDAASLGTATMATDDGGGGRLLGAAIWLAPGAFPMSATRKLRAARAMLAVLGSAPRRFARYVEFGTNVEKAFPKDPVWYLEILGVARDVQRRGIGRRLLEQGLERADADSRPAYLETSAPDNVGYYERFGFRVEREVTLLPGGPPHWAMRRPIA